MPRKERIVANRPSRTEAHFAWLASYDVNSLTDNIDAPLGTWSIDELAVEDRSCVKLRITAASVAQAALFKATTEYEQRLDKAEIHDRRGREAIELSKAIEIFLIASSADSSFDGAHDPDMKVLLAERVEGSTEISRAILRSGLEFRDLLNHFAAQRQSLSPGSNADLLAIRVAEGVQARWNEFVPLLDRHSLEDQRKTALAIWKDAQFPVPRRRDKDENLGEWMRGIFRSIGKLPST